MNAKRYKRLLLICAAAVAVHIFASSDTRSTAELSMSTVPQVKHNSQMQDLNSKTQLKATPVLKHAEVLFSLHEVEPHEAQIVNLFKEALGSLVHTKAMKQTVARKPLFPRKLLVREKIGLRWNMYPEKYWETEVLPRLPSHITVLDVGANAGQFAIPMAERGHTVISLEPNANTCNTLKNNLDSRGLAPRVIVHCVAASDKEGVVRFQETRDSTGFTAATTTNKEGTIEIMTKRVDDLVDASQELFLFKTDTQGFEMDVLQGARRVLNGNQVFLLLVEVSYGLLKRAGTDPNALLNLIYDLGFVCTYMAVHTRMEQKDQLPLRYSMVEYYPDRGSSGDWISFDTFTDSLRYVDAPGAAGVSGWSDLLCFKPQ